MCKYKTDNQSLSSRRYYTLGVHDTAQFIAPRRLPPLVNTSMTAVNHQSPPSAPAVTSPFAATTSRPRDVSEAKNVSRSESGRTQDVDGTVRADRETLRTSRRLAGSTTTRRVERRARPTTRPTDAAVDQDDDERDVIDLSPPVVALLYHGTRCAFQSPH